MPSLIIYKKTLGPDDEEDDLAEDTFIEFGGADPGGKPIPSIITPDHAMGGKCRHRSFKSESLIPFILRPIKRPIQVYPSLVLSKRNLT